MKPKLHWANVLGFLALTAVALWLRGAYLQWGIPGFYLIGTVPVPGLHPDEPVLIGQIEGLLSSPGRFPVFTYPPLQALLGASFAWASGLRDRTDLFFIGRSISVLASLATVWVVFLLGRLWDRRLAWIGAIFMALAMVAAHQAHWANPEALCALLITFSAWLFLRRPEPASAALAGIALGLAVCAKYIGVLFLHLPALAWLFIPETPLGRSRFPWRRWLAFYGAFGVTLAAVMGVYLWRDWTAFRQFIQTSSLWAHGAGLFGMHPAPVAPPSYTLTVLPFGLGLPIYASALAGILVAAIQRRHGLFLALLPLPFWVFLETLNYRPPRFSLHLLPFLCLLAAYLFNWWLSSHRGLLRWLPRLTLAGVVAYSLAYGIAYIRCLDPGRDARIAMERWTRARPPETVALIGIDEANYRFGLCRYRHSIGFSGPPLNGAGFRYLVVPAVFREMLNQWCRLEASGYRYTRWDWWPANPPDPAFRQVVRNIDRRRGFRKITAFENLPEFCGLRMEAIHLPYTYFWLSNLDIEVYQAVPAGR